MYNLIKLIITSAIFLFINLILIIMESKELRDLIWDYQYSSEKAMKAQDEARISYQTALTCLQSFIFQTGYIPQNGEIIKISYMNIRVWTDLDKIVMFEVVDIKEF